ncbi:hypothetical protein NDU88_012579 [Pleurodeles waltl]|uniref:Uncharacterized protein n=1 Tax=Pleurodeles waltl TaxID=8319 RepID=A0AAV7R0G3_PLEWA|nr:hypothetical protein NDU88_012579 [Pleurodeles waltl]
MAKNTLSSRFRKLDIDQFDENKFVEEPQEEAAEQHHQQPGPEEGAVESLLRGYPSLTWGGGGCCWVPSGPGGNYRGLMRKVPDLPKDSIRLELYFMLTSEDFEVEA